MPGAPAGSNGDEDLARRRRFGAEYPSSSTQGTAMPAGACSPQLRQNDDGLSPYPIEPGRDTPTCDPPKTAQTMTGAMANLSCPPPDFWGLV